MLRGFTSVLTRVVKMASPANKVPIPRNGVDYRGKVVLAPMVRSGELPMRLLSLKYGADLVWGPETIDKAIAGATRKVCPQTGTVLFTRTPSHGNREPDPNARESILYRLHPEREGRKLVFQLGTASPELAVQAARVVAADVAGIDVNSGCPKPFSTLGGMGAALLKEPDRLCSILEALVKEIVPEFQIGISVKIRILDDPKDTEALVRRLVATGITGLTVHCRTTPMRPRERAIRDQLHMIADICREAGVACLMNGDVTNYDEAIALAQEYRCDGGMIATAAEQNPTVFLNAENGGPLPRGHLVREYLETAISVNNKWGNTKFCLAQLMPTKDKRGPFLSRSRCHEDVVKALGFDDMLDLARETDTRYGLTLNGKANRKHKGGQKQAQQQTKTKTKDGPPATNGTHESNGVKRSEPERSPERATHTPKKMRLEDVVEQPMANTAQQAMSV